MKVCEAGSTLAQRRVVVCDVHGAFLRSYLSCILYLKFLGIHLKHIHLVWHEILPRLKGDATELGRWIGCFITKKVKGNPPFH